MDFFLQIFTNGLLTGFVYALMALAIVIIYKSSSIFNFAHGSLVGLCTFFVWQMVVGWGLPLYAAFIFELAAIAALAYALQQLVLKPLTGQPLMAAIMSTIALGKFFSGIVVLFWPGPGRVLPVWIKLSILKFGPGTVISSDSLINFIRVRPRFHGLPIIFSKDQTWLGDARDGRGPYASAKRGREG